MCKPEKEGGRGIRTRELWNLAAIGKTTWDVSCLQEFLWIHWVHGVHTKGGNWLICNPPPTVSWILRKLCKVKEKLGTWMTIDNYKINVVYKKLMGDQTTISWCKVVWHKSFLPKARFVCWLAMLNKPKTRDHFKCIGVLDDDSCPFCCDSIETTMHLFYECRYNQSCITYLSSWPGV